MRTGCTGIDSLPPLDTSATRATVEQSTYDASCRLEHIVRAVGHHPNADTGGFVQRVIDWEGSLYAHRLTSVSATSSPDLAGGFTKQRFQDYLRDRFPGQPDLEVLKFERLVGGFSKITILVELNEAVHGARSIAIQASIVAGKPILAHLRGTAHLGGGSRS
jgi:hypothetical protein